MKARFCVGVVAVRAAIIRNRKKKKARHASRRLTEHFSAARSDAGYVGGSGSFATVWVTRRLGGTSAGGWVGLCGVEDSVMNAGNKARGSSGGGDGGGRGIAAPLQREWLHHLQKNKRKAGKGRQDRSIGAHRHNTAAVFTLPFFCICTKRGKSQRRTTMLLLPWPFRRGRLEKKHKNKQYKQGSSVVRKVSRQKTKTKKLKVSCKQRQAKQKRGEDVCVKPFAGSAMKEDR